MLEFFRRNLFVNSLLLLPYTILLRIGSLINPSVYQLNQEDGYINHLIFSLLQDSPIIQTIIAIILIFFQANYINHIINKNRIAPTPNLFSGMIYIILASIIPEFMTLSPALIATTFVLIALDNLFQSNKKMSSAGKIFNVAFFISISSLIYLPIIIYIIVGYIGLIIVRSFKFRERLQFVIGIFIPYFLISSYYKWNDVIGTYLGSYLSKNLTFKYLVSGVSMYNLIVILTFVVLCGIAVLNYNEYRKKKTIHVQKQIDIFFWFLIFSIPTILFWNNLGLTHFIILIPLLSILSGISLIKMKNKFLAELIHLFAILFVFFTQFELWTI